MSVMCRQCEQAACCEGCKAPMGVCGKEENVAALQNLLIDALQSIAVFSEDGKNENVSSIIREGLFTTVTNVDFDAEHIVELINNIYTVVAQLKGVEVGFEVTTSVEEKAEIGKKVGLLAVDMNNDVRSLREIVLYGIKGVAAYADHAAVLGYRDNTVDAFLAKALLAIKDDGLTVDDLVALTMEVGQVNLTCMKLLDQANTETYGHPEPTVVSTAVKKGPAIIVTGHDLHDMKLLLEQTEGKGVNIYTHGEMLPTLAYPELKKYSHFVGHFGTAWQNQRVEFDGLPAAILFTTNCIQRPKDTYKDNVFTTGLVRWPGCTVIGKDKDFTAVINKAIELGGFEEDKQGNSMTIGFGHKTVLSVADKVIAGVKAGAIKHFFLVGGCDGAKPGRNYYTEFVEQTPKDTVVLTLACGKFRFNDLQLGDIDGIPRLLDIGQCNDAYSAIVIASALAEAFECGVNDLPLSIVLSWYEQKAVCILLTLLSLGIQNIKIGPSLPAFITSNILDVLVEKFSIAPIATPEEDLKEILGGA